MHMLRDFEYHRKTSTRFRGQQSTMAQPAHPNDPNNLLNLFPNDTPSYGRPLTHQQTEEGIPSHNSYFSDLV